MAIFLDSANLGEARRAKEFGWVHGVTTNPILLAKAGAPPGEVLKDLSRLEFHQVFYQLISPDRDGMLAEAHMAAGIIKQGLVLKIPPTETGFRFIVDHGNLFPCCVTAVFDPSQALVARSARAAYVAVYVHRATEQLGDGLQLVGRLKQVLDGSQTEILAASLKSRQQAVEACIAGAQHLTLPFEILEKLAGHPLSVKTIDQFMTVGTGIREITRS